MTQKTNIRTRHLIFRLISIQFGPPKYDMPLVRHVWMKDVENLKTYIIKPLTIDKNQGFSQIDYAILTILHKWMRLHGIED